MNRNLSIPSKVRFSDYRFLSWQAPLTLASSRNDLSFDFAQDPEVLEGPIAMLSQAGACSYMWT
jgi:hypothetical protein